MGLNYQLDYLGSDIVHLGIYRFISDSLWWHIYIFKRVTKKRQRKLQEVDPSEGLSNEKRLPDIYKPKHGLGFVGYIFLIIIIGFSIVGILKTFEKDLINYFPETEYLYISLNEQLEFLAESVKNIIVIIKDLINSY